MKIETAYRKLFKHRFRWRIITRFDADNRPWVTAELRFPEDNWPGSNWPLVVVSDLGIANSWNNAAARIEELNQVVDAYHALQEAKLNAGVF